ncbi:MAG: hypothetical protein UX84_C0007G0023 [Microgenomates group bacterium GW2011_GWD1_47_13]|nr:MAG: hypothetical protein UX63_C0021G0001 [Microgenomates group bacterium GW2011_GWB1_46_7]KKU62437.1 MAG: hypothetical protein UX84_C0007G0023 [Microgenomates group bacterium GW2011_GWD1_47_13]
MRHMKRLIALVTLLFALATPVAAETVRTCSSVYGGGEVCGEATTNVTIEHKVVETGISNEQIFKMLASVAGAALLATVLYKLTYKSYILG